MFLLGARLLPELNKVISYGPYCYGLYGYGPCSHSLYSYGLRSHGLYSCTVMAYVVMACTVMAYVVMACKVMAYIAMARDFYWAYGCCQICNNVHARACMRQQRYMRAHARTRTRARGPRAPGRRGAIAY